MTSWSELLPGVGPAAALDGGRIGAYFTAAASVVVAARNADDLDEATAVLARPVLEVARRADAAAAASPRRGERLDNLAVTLTGVTVVPIGVRAEEDRVLLRARLVHEGIATATGAALSWQEVWVVAVPFAATGPVVATRCSVCGAPRQSVQRCRYCGTVAAPPGLAEAGWQVVERHPS